MEVSALVTKFDQPVRHLASNFANGIEGFGDGVVVCVIGSGLPDHPALPSGESANFTTSASDVDVLGHASIVTGIMGANDPDMLVGIAPAAKYLFAKAVDDQSLAKFDAVIASILWAIIKEVDVIVCPLASDTDNSAFHDAIRKAHHNGICVIASCGGQENGGYPAAYKEVLSVSGRGTNGARFSAEGKIDIPAERVESTYLDDAYVRASGSPIACGIVGGLCACLVGGIKESGKKVTPKEVYATLTKAMKS